EWGDGLEDLVRDLAERLVPEAPPEGAGVPFREWQVRVIERVRRRLMEGRGDRAARLLERLGKR
ncbi:MAG TPA: hypothetical protein VFT74_01070, partial [Isosphaeraceae bacterium]|nr:hypothetical protein [Isosphaeraceae bacterium]